jgi:ATP-binding cassette subfamily C protein CydC
MSDLRRLLALLRPYAGWIALGVLASLATLLANVTLMATSGWFISAMALAGAAHTSMNYFTPAALIRACAMLRSGGRYGERLITHDATLRLLTGLRVWLYAQLGPLAPARLQGFRSGDLLSRLRADVDTLDHLYLRILAPALTAIIGGLALCAYLLRYDLHLALLLALFLALAGVAVPAATQRLAEAPGRGRVHGAALLRSAAVDLVQGLGELQVYGAAQAQAYQIARLGRELTDHQTRLAGLAGLSQGSVGLAAQLAMWLVAWHTIPLAQQGHLAPPDLALLVLLTLAAFETVASLPGAFQALGETRAAARRVWELVDTKPAVTDPPGPSPTPMGFGLSLSGVGFHYPGDSAPVLDGIDLEIPEGGRLGIVGESGSGKTTLLHLLAGFWAPNRGQIRLGGQPLEAFRGADLRRHLAVVAQDSHLFTGTVRDNLLLAVPEADAGALEQACRAAQVHDFLSGLLEGYDTWIGEAGLTLSGGEARRLVIAQALLKDPPVLLLDEPTEGLDPATEQALLRALDRLMTGRTVLLITHRPAALGLMDRVLTLHGGRLHDAAPS